MENIKIVRILTLKIVMCCHLIKLKPIKFLVCNLEAIRQILFLSLFLVCVRVHVRVCLCVHACMCE